MRTAARATFATRWKVRVCPGRRYHRESPLPRGSGVQECSHGCCRKREREGEDSWSAAATTSWPRFVPFQFPLRFPLFVCVLVVSGVTKNPNPRRSYSLSYSCNRVLDRDCACSRLKLAGENIVLVQVTRAPGARMIVYFRV